MNWSQCWPSQPGEYWLVDHARGDRRVELATVQFADTGDAWQLSVVCGGRFIYGSESRGSWWLPADVPSPPKEVL